MLCNGLIDTLQELIREVFPLTGRREEEEGGGGRSAMNITS